MPEGRDHLSRAEVGKDAIQATAEAAATTVGEVVTIVTGAIKDVAGAVGGFATEIFEIRDASRRALGEHDRSVASAEPLSRPDPLGPTT
jgi:hypothetical protein